MNDELRAEVVDYFYECLQHGEYDHARNAVNFCKKHGLPDSEIPNVYDIIWDEANPF